MGSSQSPSDIPTMRYWSSSRQQREGIHSFKRVSQGPYNIQQRECIVSREVVRDLIIFQLCGIGPLVNNNEKVQFQGRQLGPLYYSKYGVLVLLQTTTRRYSFKGGSQGPYNISTMWYWSSSRQQREGIVSREVVNNYAELVLQQTTRQKLEERSMHEK